MARPTIHHLIPPRAPSFLVVLHKTLVPHISNIIKAFHVFFPFFLHLPFSLRFSLLFSYSYENFELYCGISRYFAVYLFTFFLFRRIFMNETYIRYKNILHIFLFLYISPVYFFFLPMLFHILNSKKHTEKENQMIS